MSRRLTRSRVSVGRAGKSNFSLGAQIELSFYSQLLLSFIKVGSRSKKSKRKETSELNLNRHCFLKITSNSLSVSSVTELVT